MTKTKIELINEYLEKIGTLKEKARQLQLKTVTEAREDYNKIKLNRLLSEEGKSIEREQVRQFYAETFLKGMQDINTEYARYIKFVKQMSQEVVATANAYSGTDAQKVSFELSMRDLQTRVMLHHNLDEAVKLIEDFVRKQDDAYYAQQIAQQFPNLVSTLASTTDPALKLRLTHAYKTAQKNSVTEEKLAAQKALELSDQPDFVLTVADAPSFVNLRSVLGRQAAQSANEPAVHLERMALGKESKEHYEYGEFEQPTFNEGQ
ncbi:hypothetical protein [Lysinibacillus fusiformis]|uniref:hypothetical protein n=1 Tax=Lysinibacillus fusiformis TaxID=28031 RepID=UPI0034E1CD5D